MPDAARHAPIVPAAAADTRAFGRDHDGPLRRPGSQDIPNNAGTGTGGVHASIDGERPGGGAVRRGAELDRAVRDRLHAKIGEKRFERWLRHARVRVHEGTVEVLAEDAFAARWIDQNLSAVLREAATWAVGPDARVDVRPIAPAPRAAQSGTESAPGVDGTGDRQLAADRTGASGGPRRRRSAPNGPADAIDRAHRLRSLEDFVIGDSNRFAHAAAAGMLDVRSTALTGIKCGPVFIHGECGVGKTHLLQGVCRAAMERSGYRMRVVYVTAEQFTNEYITSVRNNALDRFRARYRAVDLLAIDDVHFLANKVRTQNEFLHTLDAIDLTGSRVLLASDSHPSMIRRFHRGLVSRFMSGTVAAIERPDRLTRTALVNRLIHSRGLRLTDEARDTLAGQCVGSVRELEGAVNKLSAHHTLMAGRSPSDPIERAFVDRVFRAQDSQPARPVRPAEVIETICATMLVTRADLLGSSRHRRVVLARSIASWLIRDMTTMSFPEIARALGREAHSTVHTAVRRMDGQLTRGEKVDSGSGDGARCLRELVQQIRHDVLRSIVG